MPRPRGRRQGERLSACDCRDGCRPLGLVVGYGLLRLSTTLFTELRELVFARVTQGTVREISLKVFRHLHALSLGSTSNARPAA